MCSVAQERQDSRKATQTTLNATVTVDSTQNFKELGYLYSETIFLSRIFYLSSSHLPKVRGESKNSLNKVQILSDAA